MLIINWTNAFIITFLGIAIVFIVLCLLIALLYGFGKITSKKVNPVTDKKEQHSKAVSGAESVAIAMALHLYYADIHGEESDVITIKNIDHRYSPWNSKIH